MIITMRETPIKALVTGASGFIGKHLVEKLTELGWEIVHYFGDADVIFHLAGRRDGDIWESNVHLTAKVLDDAKKWGVKRVIFTSSCAAAQPVNDYGMSKKLAEELCQWYRDKHELDVVVLRLFNVYGPGDTKSDVAQFAEAIRTGIPPKIYGKDCVRDYIHVDDVVRALIGAPGFNEGGICNIGTGQSTSIGELWDLCAELSGSELRAQYLPSERDNIRYAVAPQCQFSDSCIPLWEGLRTVLPQKELCESC